MKRAKVIVIVPAYNEEECILRTTEELDRFGYDYVVINDGSRDNTANILDEHNIPHIDLIQNLGIGGAVQTGYIYAKEHNYDIAVQFDGDGQHDAAYIEDLICAIEYEGANMAIGSRFVGSNSAFQSSAARRAGIRILSAVLKLSTGEHVVDITSGFRAVDRNAIKLFSRSYPTDYPEPESTAYAISQGLIVKEISVSMHERMGGESSIKPLDAIWYMLKVGMSVLLRGSRKRG